MSTPLLRVGPGVRMPPRREDRYGRGRRPAPARLVRLIRTWIEKQLPGDRDTSALASRNAAKRGASDTTVRNVPQAQFGHDLVHLESKRRQRQRRVIGQGQGVRRGRDL